MKLAKLWAFLSGFFFLAPLWTVFKGLLNCETTCFEIECICIQETYVGINFTAFSKRRGKHIHTHWEWGKPLVLCHRNGWACRWGGVWGSCKRVDAAGIMWRIFGKCELGISYALQSQKVGIIRSREQIEACSPVCLTLGSLPQTATSMKAFCLAECVPELW